MRSFTRTISLRNDNWKKIDEVVNKSRGSFRSRSHVVEHLINTDQSLQELYDEVLKDG